MLRPPLWTQESQRRSRPFIIGPFQSAAQQPLPEFPVPFPHGRGNTIPFQIQFQKAAEDSCFLHRIKHIRTPFTNRGYCNTRGGNCKQAISFCCGRAITVPVLCVVPISYSSAYPAFRRTPRQWSCSTHPEGSPPAGRWLQSLAGSRGNNMGTAVQAGGNKALP